MGTKPKTPATRRPAARNQIPVAEWIASGMGVLLVGFTLGSLIHAAATDDDRPADVRVELIAVERLPEGYLARFRATNHGGEGASDVQIRGVHGEGPQAEASEAMIDFLPPQAQKGGGLFFRHEPSAATLSIRATGYQEP